MRWVGHVAQIGDIRNSYKVLVGNLEGKSPLEIPRRRWKDNIKMDLRKIGFVCVDLIHMARDRDQWRVLANTVLNLGVAQKAGDFLIG
jgi:hypothetical protein